MENILNKSYKRKNAIDSDIFLVTSIDTNNEYVTFANNAKCKISTLLTDFEEIKIDKQIMENNTDDIIDSDKFFNTPLNDDELLNQIELVAKNPNTIIQPTKQIIENENDNFSNRFDNNIIDKPNDNISNEIKINKTPRLPEYDVFDNVNLTEEIEINVPFKIKLPRAEKIDILNDMFKTKFTSYISKKYINDNIINNSIKLQLLIQESIETWVNDQIYSSKPKKKTIKKDNKKDNIEIKDIETKHVNALNDTPKNVETNNITNFFNLPKWDGDIKKLYLINTEEQYNKVKSEYLKLKDLNEEIESSRLEDMLNIYEEQIR